VLPLMDAAAFRRNAVSSFFSIRFRFRRHVAHHLAAPTLLATLVSVETFITLVGSRCFCNKLVDPNQFNPLVQTICSRLRNKYDTRIAGDEPISSTSMVLDPYGKGKGSPVVPASPVARVMPAPLASALATVDRRQFMRTAYFFTFFAMTLMQGYGTLLYTERGFPVEQIGWLMALAPLGTVFVTPVAATMAETRHLQAHVIVGAVLITSAMVIVIGWAPWKPVIIAAAVVSGSVYRMPLTLLDEYVIAVIGTENRADYGKYRSFGAIGWGLGAVGFALIGGGISWAAATIVYAVSYIGVLVSITYAPVMREPPGTHRYVDVLRRVFLDVRVLGHFLAFSCMGIGTSLVNSYLPLYLANELNAPPVLLGLSLLVAELAQIPMMRNSPWLYRHFSVRQLLVVAMSAWVVRGVGYSLLTNPWQVLALEPLHGLTFSLSWLAGMHYFPNAFPKEYGNSSISLIHASVSGVGPILGNILGGYAYATLGPRMMFQAAAMGMTTAALLYLTFDTFTSKPLPSVNQEDTQPAETSVAVDSTAQQQASFTAGATSMAEMQPESPRNGDCLDALPPELQEF
jgi:PPP family 3-phenylpropionic acid transporter